MSIATERRSLDFLLSAAHLAASAPGGQCTEPVVPFAAFRDEVPVIVVAVLERTVAYHAIGDRYDTGVIRLDRCFVDPASVEWKAKAGDVENGQKKPGQAYRNYRPNAPATEQTRALSDARALSDERALADQEAKREEKTMTRGVNPRTAEERERLAAAGLKRCPKCKLEKPRDQFSATAHYCRPCMALISARKRDASPFKAKAGKPRAIPHVDLIPGSVTMQVTFTQPPPAARVLVELQELLADRERINADIQSAMAKLHDVVFPAMVVPSA